jgi:hypothetical protein
MARPAKTEMAAPTGGPLDPPLETLDYIGPAGQTSPVLGLLSVGARFQVNALFAAYLVAQHPDVWTRPSEPAAAAPAKTGRT